MTDPIERLRAADPVPEPVSHPSDPPVRATLEEILMTEIHTDTDTGADTRPDASRARWFRDPRILAAAAALLLVVGIVGAAVGDGSSSEAPVDAALPTDGDPGTTPTEPADEPQVVSPGGGEPGDGTQASACVEHYALDTLVNREYAFDGTVAAVDGPAMTFDVHEWFRGGDGATVTLDHQGLEGMRFAPEGPSLETGTRVLVAGDGGFVWPCGFTQLHDPALADQWRSTLAG